MKTSIRLLIVLFLFVACNDQLDIVTDEPEVTTRSIVNGEYHSISNPNLLANWGNTTEIVLNTASSIQTKVTTPWSNGAATSLPTHFSNDIKKEDGWSLIFHTFKERGLNPNCNYLFFYNKLTGFIKVFYYEEVNIAQNNNGFVWVIKTSNGEKTNIFSLSEYFAKPNDSNDKNNMVLLSNAAQNPAGGIKGGWNGFEMQIPYSTDYKNIDFIIDAYNQQITTYDFAGKTTATIEGTITSTSQKSNGLLSSAANLAGSQAKSLVSKMSSGEKGSKITSALNLIPSSGYGAAIKAGLGLLFGSTSSTSSQDIKLKSSGEIKLAGNSSSIGGNSVVPIRFNLYKIMNGDASTLTNNPLKDYIVMNTVTMDTDLEYIGVWSKATAPLAQFYRYSRLYTHKQNPNQNDGWYFSECHTHCPNIFPTHGNNINIQVNPALEKYITSRKVSREFVVWNKLSHKTRIHDDFSQRNSKIFYKDENYEFFEFLAGQSYKINRTFDLPDHETWRTEYWFDWGELLGGNLLKTVTVELTYNYRGKIQTITQSRTFEVKYQYLRSFADDDSRVEYAVKDGSAIIINAGFPPYEFKNGVNKLTYSSHL